MRQASGTRRSTGPPLVLRTSLSMFRSPYTRACGPLRLTLYGEVRTGAWRENPPSGVGRFLAFGPVSGFLPCGSATGFYGPDHVLYRAVQGRALDLNIPSGLFYEGEESFTLRDSARLVGSAGLRWQISGHLLPPLCKRI